MRLFDTSVAKTSPEDLFTATPHAPENCPSPVPGEPQWVRRLPLLSNFAMRSVKVSVTKTLFEESTAIPAYQPR